MTVVTEAFTYTLYIDADGEWVMHTYERCTDGAERWFNSHVRVSQRDPFASRVTYEGWR